MQPDYYVDRDRTIVFRRADLLWLELEMVNCRVSADGTAVERVRADALSSVDVHLPFQHVLEETVGDGLMRMPVRSLAALGSKLSFAVPATPVPLPPGGLLEALDRLPFDPGHSLLEFPARLRLAPLKQVSWAMSHPPTLAGGSGGLWQARMSGYQEGWRRCVRCQGLVYSYDTPGGCPDGQPHHYADAGYSLYLNGWPEGLQGDWHRCGRCQGLSFARSKPDSCHGGQPHLPIDQYGVPHGTMPPGTEPGWLWCSRCQLLYFAHAASVCIGGRPHYPNDSGRYAVMRGPSLAATFVHAVDYRHGDEPFELSPTTYEVQQLVNGFYDAAKFAVSPLGASVALIGPYAYDPEPQEDPGIAYEHQTEFGRDVRVSVTQRGYLTTRHKASIVTVTQRRLGRREMPVVPDGFQELWAWCVICASLFYGGGSGGRCLDGRSHNTDGAPPEQMVSIRPVGFIDWRWCATCESLTCDGVCWNGEPHAIGGSLAYEVGMDGSSISYPDFSQGALRCERCGRLVNALGGCNDGAEHEVTGSYIFTVANRPVERVAVGYLHRFSCLIVTEEEVPCGEVGAGYPFGGREMPLRRLRLHTLRVPLDEQPPEGVPFWVRAGGQEVDFAVTGTDWDGRTVAFTMPLMFVPEPVADDGHTVSRVFSEGPQWRRTRPMGGQAVALANPQGAYGGSTAVPVTSMSFTLRTPEGRPAWLLDVASYEVAVDALRHFAPARSAPMRVVLSDKYTAHGLAAGNPTGAFLQIVDEVGVTFAAERVGGLATPSTVIGALSTMKGAVPLAFTDAQPLPNLAEIFGGAKLLGIVPFQDIIGQFTQVPTMLTRHLGDSVEVEYTLHATLQEKSSQSLQFGAGATLDLQATMSTTAQGTAAGQPPKGHVEGTVTDMAISVGGVVSVHFDRLHFAADAGQTPTISTGACTVAFDGDLAFLSDLADSLSQAGFGPGTTVNVTPAGIEAGYAIAVPAARVGVFTLANLALSTRLTLPFTGAAPQLRFAFSHRDRPFTVGVLFLAGTGFFALTAEGDKGVTEIEAALEFGGNCEIDVIVARGGVYAMVGIYVHLKNGQALISGYVRCGGYLDILGIISISVDFRMELTYETGSGDVYGQATLTVGISVLFFSKSLTFSVERRFAGSAPVSGGGGGAPATFRSLNQASRADADAWDQHCQAFA